MNALKFSKRIVGVQHYGLRVVMWFVPMDKDTTTMFYYTPVVPKFDNKVPCACSLCRAGTSW